MQLRDYQLDILKQLTSGVSSDLVQLDTGAGKTPIEAALAEWAPRCILIAHRNILITQISEKLAAFGLHHDTISTEFTRRRCMLQHRQHGRNFITRGHLTRFVASIGSLISRYRRGLLAIDTSLPWLIIIDEAHHVTSDNTWGQLRVIFPNARIVGFTGTPARMDGESLHVANGGLFDSLVQAESLRNDSVRKLIARGDLSDFRAYSMPMLDVDDGSTIDAEAMLNEYESDPLGNTGSVRSPRLYIAGDPVKQYRKYANGKRGVMMCPSIRNAEEFAAQFRELGIPAACISSQMSSTDVSRAIDAFISSRILMLCNVDMVGEGFDVPGIEVLLICRRTKSFIAFRQWVGRMMRPHPGKAYGIIIDMVGMICGPMGHGMPDDPVCWDLLNPPVGLTKLRHAPCLDCRFIYPIKLRECPECGAANELLRRNKVIGGHYIEIMRLDVALIQQERQSISLEEHEQRRAREIIWPYFSECGLISKTCGALRKWMVNSLVRDGVPIAELNSFLESDQCKDVNFWIKRFTSKDVGATDAKKAHKAFKEWQRLK